MGHPSTFCGILTRRSLLSRKEASTKSHCTSKEKATEVKRKGGWFVKVHTVVLLGSRLVGESGLVFTQNCKYLVLRWKCIQQVEIIYHLLR